MKKKTFNTYIILNGPHLNLFGDHAPIRLVVIRRDDVQIVGVFLDQLIEFALSEHVIIPVERYGPTAAAAAATASSSAAASVLGLQRFLRRGQAGIVAALHRLLRFDRGPLPDQHGRAPRVCLLRRRPAVAPRLSPVREPRVLAAVAPGRQ